MTGQALRIIEGWLADDRFVRVVTSDAGNAPVLWIAGIAGTLRQTIGLKAKIASVTEVWHRHHLFKASVTAAAETLREFISGHVFRREDTGLGWLARLNGSHMRRGRAVTSFATDAWNQALEPKLLRLADRVCGMTGETLSSVRGRQLLSEGGFQRFGLVSRCSQGKV